MRSLFIELVSSSCRNHWLLKIRAYRSNKDGASLSQDGGIGFVIGRQQYFQGQTTVHCETLAVRFGLQSSISRNITNLSIETDSSTIVDMLIEDRENSLGHCSHHKTSRSCYTNYTHIPLPILWTDSLSFPRAKAYLFSI